MALSEEEKEALRILMESLYETSDLISKLPVDPVTTGLIEMAAEMVNRQIELDIAFPIEEVATDDEGRPIRDEPRVPLVAPSNLSSSEEVEEITNPEDLKYIGHTELEPEEDKQPPSADELKRWFDGYSAG